jgi:hypothetical protein
VENSTILSAAPIGAKSRRKQLRERKAMEQSEANEEELKTTTTAVR